MNNNQVEIIEFTDPVCTWCWGSEPILKKLKAHFGNQITISFTMGGLVKDIRKFYDRANDIGGDPDRSNKNIIKHWLEASDRHGMPVKKDDFGLFTDEHLSSYPQNIAFKAAQMESETLAKTFLRRIRKATAAEARQTNKQEVLIELANEVGLDVPPFIERMEDGSARLAFEEDLAKTREYGVRAFPSFLLKYQGKEVKLLGYQSYESISSVIKSISNNAIKEAKITKSEESILQFIKHYKSVAPVEIQRTFEISDKEMNSVIKSLTNQNKIKKQRAGNGYFLKLLNATMNCDPDLGICRSKV